MLESKQALLYRYRRDIGQTVFAGRQRIAPQLRNAEPHPKPFP